MSYLIKNATLVNEGKRYKADVRIKGQFIESISTEPLQAENGETIIDAGGKLLIPGAIDDQVHFREPGLTHKADIYTESRAAVAGGITSFMEMPNTNPQTLTQELLQEKIRYRLRKSTGQLLVFYGCFEPQPARSAKNRP